MPHSKRLKTACLAVAGIATAWGAAPTTVHADPVTVDLTSAATMNAGASLSNPEFLYVSNTTDPGTIPGIAPLSNANFESPISAPASFSVLANYDEDLDIPIGLFNDSMSYMFIGLAPNGDLVAGLSDGAATTAVNDESSFDSLFSTGSETALITALQTPGSDSNTALTNFAGTVSDNGNINAYTYYNDSDFLGPDLDPAAQDLTLVDFGHLMNGDPDNAIFGTAALTLATETPEPASLALLGAPLLLLLGRRKRR